MPNEEELQAETLGVVKDAVDQWRSDLRLALAHHEEVVAGSLEALERAASLDLRSRLEPRLTGVLNAARGVGAPPASPATFDLAWLKTAVAAIDRATTLGEALTLLVDQSATRAGRAVVFIVKAKAAIGWYGSGTGTQNVKGLSVSLEAPGPLADASTSREPVAISGSAAAAAVAVLGGEPVAAHVLPLFVRDRVAAILYVDSAAEMGTADLEVLALLARYAARVVEILSSRPNGRSADPRAAIVEPRRETRPARPPDPAGVAVNGADLRLSDDEENAHDQARRFARLVVSEIKLYNESKLNEGRRNRDIYERLRADIERGERVYADRVPAHVRENTNYFHDELVRVLAAGDPGALGRT